MQLPTTIPLAAGMGRGLWVGYKVAGLLGREHQGKVCRFVKILAKGYPKTIEANNKGLQSSNGKAVLKPSTYSLTKNRNIFTSYWQ
jgi:hypothetical protein